MYLGLNGKSPSYVSWTILKKRQFDLSWTILKKVHRMYLGFHIGKSPFYISWTIFKCRSDELNQINESGFEKSFI